MRTLAVLITVFLFGALISVGKAGFRMEADQKGDSSQTALQANSGENAQRFGWRVEEYLPEDTEDEVSEPIPEEGPPPDIQRV